VTFWILIISVFSIQPRVWKSVSRFTTKLVTG